MITCSIPLARTALIACGAGLTLLACTAERPQSTVSRALVSGVTANNGGGMAPARFGTLSPMRAGSGPTLDTGNMAYPAPLPQGDLQTTPTP